MCRVLRVARSCWYTWCQQRTRISKRQQFRQHCDSVVREAFTRSKQRYRAHKLPVSENLLEQDFLRQRP